MICRSEFNVVNTATAVHRIARISMRSQVDGTDARLLGLLQRAVASLSEERWEPRQLANTAWALARARIKAPDLFAALAVKAEAFAKSFKPQELANLTWAYATAGVAERRFGCRWGLRASRRGPTRGALFCPGAAGATSRTRDIDPCRLARRGLRPPDTATARRCGRHAARGTNRRRCGGTRRLSSPWVRSMVHSQERKSRQATVGSPSAVTEAATGAGAAASGASLQSHSPQPMLQRSYPRCRRTWPWLIQGDSEAMGWRVGFVSMRLSSKILNRPGTPLAPYCGPAPHVHGSRRVHSHITWPRHSEADTDWRTKTPSHHGHTNKHTQPRAQCRRARLLVSLK